MIEVSNETKQAYMSDVSHKELRVVFPELGLTYGNSSIDSESMKVIESISNKDSVEFVGCIASSLQISIYGIEKNIKGKKIELYIKTDNTQEIPLFKGIVDSAVIDSAKYFKKITAYDELYTKGNLDVVRWYNQQFPTNESTRTMKQIRDSLFSYIGIEQVSISLPNDNIVIGKKFDPKSLKCITVLKSICQINGSCGIINRYGKFDYRFISGVSNGIHPSLTLFPGAMTFPEKSNIAHTFAFYETLKFQEYFVKPMERVQIRQDENDIGVTVGTGANKYIIQSNMFAQGLVPSVATAMAQNILEKLKGVNFYPFTSKNNGLPFVECGDSVVYVLNKDREGRYATNSFFVLNRTISGVQLLKDSYSAEGNEEQSEFITDLQTTLDTIKMQGGGGGGGGDMSNYYTKDQVNDIVSELPQTEDVEEFVSESVSQMETPTGFNVVSTYTLPTSRAANTIYLIQGGVIMI